MLDEQSKVRWSDYFGKEAEITGSLRELDGKPHLNVTSIVLAAATDPPTQPARSKLPDREPLKTESGRSAA
jgi:hypothetical protein